jgi:hypothetical protein
MGHGGTRRGAGRPRGSSAPRVHAAPEPNEDLRAYARRYGHEAIDFLAKTMRGEKAPYSARVVAADRLLERGYGRPLAIEPPDPKAIEGIVIEPLRKSDGNGHDEPVRLEDWRATFLLRIAQPRALCPGPCTPFPRNPLSPLRRLSFCGPRAAKLGSKPRIENAIAAYEKRAEEARHDLAARVRFR